MAVVRPRRGVLAKLLADHVFGHVHGDVLLTVVDTKGEAHELGQDGGAAGPDLDHVVAARLSRVSFGLFQDVAVNKGAFPNRASHILAALSSWRAASG